MKYLLLIFTFCFSVFGFSQDVNEEQTNTNSDYYSQSERILNYHSDIKVDVSGDLEVTETIKVNALEQNIRHGIFRTFLTERQLNGKNQKVKYKITSVTRDGKTENYHTETGSGYYKIYIGSKETDLPAGQYVFAITYRVAKQIGFFSKFDELYWNVNGLDWDFPVDKISAKVTLPANVKILQNACYTGASGSKESNCSSKEIDSHTIEWNAENLNAKENLTIAVGFNKGVFVPPPPPSFLEKNGVLLLLGLSMLGMIGYGLSLWKKYGVDPPKPTVYPQFNVPEDMSPATLGYIKKESFNNKFLTATLVNLSIKGFTKIVETESKGFLGLSSSKNYTIQKVKEPDQSLAKEEIGVMNDLFNNRDEVTLDGSYDSKIESAVDNFESNIEYQHKKFLTEGNNQKFVLYLFLFASAVYFSGLILAGFKDDDFMFSIIGIFPYFISIVIYFVATRFLGKVKIKGCVSIFVLFFALSFILPFLTMGFSSALPQDYRYCFQFAILSLLLLLAFQYFIKRPSEEKLRQQSLIDGFKMYMGAAENEQIKFHNSPQMTPEIFEKYLPYAMVLGVDDIWGKKFETALLAMATGYTASWYVGNFVGFNNFGSTLNSGLTDSISSGSTAPSNSSSGGSGSSGGGFSGGGGGGGGGGGW
ncbi:Predicted membrane protein [Soonwooa buanensis]|uniref:Predicted membrane protein n=1 Tax=Soonwooa buanensis TaxID=619805 RepID=A0A1T5ES47_9FLAO|nr:DUF2207 domain-containing protein [Soonwooa buanensis]SKB86766.1 Predicted membrane protein [Soonwooa buanensis]